MLATVTAWCARLDVLATDMRVEQRSLEDVFLDLTGRELRVMTETVVRARHVHAATRDRPTGARCWPRSSGWS